MSSAYLDDQVIKEMGVNVQTPSGNTVLFGQASQPLSHSPFTVKVDWVNLTFSFTDVETLYERIECVSRMLLDDVQWQVDRPLFRGRTFQSQGLSAHGLRVGFTPPSDDGSLGDAFLSIPGSAINRVPQKEIFDFIRAAYHVWNASFSRIDIALDDYTKSLNPFVVEECLKNRFFTGFRKLPDGWKKKSGERDVDGWTYYLGCEKSDKQLCIYDKSFQTNGEIDSYRVEMRFKRGLAPQLARMIATGSRCYLLHPESADQLMCSLLSGFVFNHISFVDRRAIDRQGNEFRQKADRSPEFPWWQHFRESVNPMSLKLSKPAIKPTLERIENWHDKCVATSLAIKRIELGDEEFVSYVNGLADKGEAKLKHQHIAMLNAREIEVTTLSETLEIMQNGENENGSVTVGSGKEVSDISQGNCGLSGSEFGLQSSGIYEQLEFLL